MKVHHYAWVFALLLSSCATPSERFAYTASAMGFEELTIRSDRFAHQIYRRAVISKNTTNKTLHVYLDGDIALCLEVCSLSGIVVNPGGGYDDLFRSMNFYYCASSLDFDLQDMAV